MRDVMMLTTQKAIIINKKEKKIRICTPIIIKLLILDLLYISKCFDNFKPTSIEKKSEHCLFIYQELKDGVYKFIKLNNIKYHRVRFHDSWIPKKKIKESIVFFYLEKKKCPSIKPKSMIS